MTAAVHRDGERGVISHSAQICAVDVIVQPSTANFATNASVTGPPGTGWKAFERRKAASKVRPNENSLAGGIYGNRRPDFVAAATEVT